jgi:hypothetical protein
MPKLVNMLKFKNPVIRRPPASSLSITTRKLRVLVVPSHQPRGSTMTWPNTLYSVFSFIGFLFCAIPFPWHLKRKVEPLLRFLHLSMIEINSILQIGTLEPAFSWLGQGLAASTSSLTLSFGMVMSSTGVQCGVTSVRLTLT